MDKKDRFVKMISENQGLIFKVTSVYTDNRPDSDDLSQEIIYQLWKSFDSFNERSKLTTWMYRVALNTAIFFSRQQKKNVLAVSDDRDVSSVAEERDEGEAEKIRLLYEQIGSFSLLDKAIILLYLEGRSHEEIALIVGISISNVGTRISRIREKLKTLKTRY